MSEEEFINDESPASEKSDDESEPLLKISPPDEKPEENKDSEPKVLPTQLHNTLVEFEEKKDPGVEKKSELIQIVDESVRRSVPNSARSVNETILIENGDISDIFQYLKKKTLIVQDENTLSNAVNGHVKQISNILRWKNPQNTSLNVYGMKDKKEDEKWEAVVRKFEGLLDNQSVYACVYDGVDPPIEDNIKIYPNQVSKGSSSKVVLFFYKEEENYYQMMTMNRRGDNNVIPAKNKVLFKQKISAMQESKLSRYVAARKNSEVFNGIQDKVIVVQEENSLLNAIDTYVNYNISSFRGITDDEVDFEEIWKNDIVITPKMVNDENKIWDLIIGKFEKHLVDQKVYFVVYDGNKHLDPVRCGKNISIYPLPKSKKGEKQPRRNPVRKIVEDGVEKVVVYLYKEGENYYPLIDFSKKVIFSQDHKKSELLRRE